ncbi:hypothetical protein [Cerasicoccus maritimus]|uniref:hypothetical protein n=1 Tax=Cerasicoccus maritimus TaxID=490089 RepID=UPI0028525684|nr:hypothetical protein [Cerasicoccus maritimus]
MRYLSLSLLTILASLSLGCEGMKGHYESELKKAREREEAQTQTIAQLQAQNTAMQDELFALKKADHVLVTGELSQPGIYYIGQEATLVDVMLKAGGETRFTSKHAVITRDGEGIDIDITRPKSSAITILPGDILYFERASF